MSTKTSIKRIALVAVAALGFGMVSTVSPANAAAGTPVFGVTTALSSAGNQSATVTATQVAGAANYVGISANANSAGLTNATDYDYVTVSGSTFSKVVWAANSLDSVTSTSTAIYKVVGSAIANNDTFWVATPTAGTITVKYVRRAFLAGVATDTTVQTITITVGSSSVDAGNSTSVLNSGVGIAAVSDATVTAPASDYATSKVAGTVVLTMVNLLGSAYKGTDFSATVSGPALLVAKTAACNATEANGTKVTAIDLATTPGSAYLCVVPDGSTGVATINIYAGSAVWATEKVTFYGTLTKLVATPSKKIFAGTVAGTVNAGAALADTYGVRLQGLDVNGVEVPLTAGTVTVTSADTTQVSSAAAAGVLSDDTGYTGQLLLATTFPATATGGKSTVVTYTVGTIATTATITYGASAAAGGSQVVTMTTDKDTYLPGEKVTITVTGKDSSGNYLGDGAQALFTAAGAPASNVNLVGNLPVASPVLSGGVATYTLYAPFVAGTVVVTATQNNAAGSASTVTFAVADAYSTSDAVDAANEATDAANAATDAANAAAEAADAATAAAQDAQAAVAELATQVAALIAGIKAQITSLTNLIIKIQKKLKA